MASQNDKLIQKLKNLTPTEFENFSFDLLLLKGLKNLIWRTPGPDGGRDIQGENISYDISDSLVLEKWYIECKRYESNLDWPAVFNKISFAENHDADYLLIITTSFLTPQCKSELEIRQRARKNPIVRYWDASRLPRLISRYPILAFKYSLQENKTLESISIMPILSITSKVIQCSYGIASFENYNNKALELGAALVDLISARLKENEILAFSKTKRFVIERDKYSWVDISRENDLSAFDSYGMRTLVSAIRFYFKMDRVALKFLDNMHLEVEIVTEDGIKQFEELLKEISIWSNLEFYLSDSLLTINARE